MKKAGVCPLFFNSANNTKSTAETTASTADTVKPDPKSESGDNIFSGKTAIETILDKIIAARQKSKKVMITVSPVSDAVISQWMRTAAKPCSDSASTNSGST